MSNEGTAVPVASEANGWTEVGRAESDVKTAAARLTEASRTRTPCQPVRDLIDPLDVGAAYEVQALLTEQRLAGGVSIIGRKIGLTSAAVQQQLGVDRPDFGVLFSDMGFVGGEEIPISRLLQPRVEAEVAFVLGADLAEGTLEYDQVRDGVQYAVAALEICDSRIAGWDISFADTVADNASAGLFVLGPQRRTLDEFDPVEVSMSMSIDSEVVSTGTGAACLGDPVEALVWLARTAREFGAPLRAGQIVLSGALGPMAPVLPGQTVSAFMAGLGAVSARFSDEVK